MIQERLNLCKTSNTSIDFFKCFMVNQNHYVLYQDLSLSPRFSNGKFRLPPQPKKVVYTCICGGYDKLISQTYVREGWDYICFTDNLKLLEKGNPLWTIRPIEFAELDPTRNARWHKMFPNKILNDYDISLYIDGNFNIKAPDLFDYIDNELIKEESIKLALHKHQKRELAFIKRLRFVKDLAWMIRLS